MFSTCPGKPAILVFDATTSNEPTMSKPTDSRPKEDGRRWPLWKNHLVSITALLVSFGLAETIATAFYRRGDIEPQSIWVHATDNQTAAVEFDPVLGYRLAAAPTRMMIIGSNGAIESSGTFRGNNLGAPDNDEFSPNRGPDNRKRFVVFGDSLTSGLYLERSWPDVAETLACLSSGRLGVGTARQVSVVHHKPLAANVDHRQRAPEH